MLGPSLITILLGSTGPPPSMSGLQVFPFVFSEPSQKRFVSIILHAKADYCEEFRSVLLDTAGNRIAEAVTGDDFWSSDMPPYLGASTKAQHFPASNMLGFVLESIRQDLMKEVVLCKQLGVGYDIQGINPIINSVSSDELSLTTHLLPEISTVSDVASFYPICTSPTVSQQSTPPSLPPPSPSSSQHPSPSLPPLIVLTHLSDYNCMNVLSSALYLIDFYVLHVLLYSMVQVSFTCTERKSTGGGEVEFYISFYHPISMIKTTTIKDPFSSNQGDRIVNRNIKCISVLPFNQITDDELASDLHNNTNNVQDQIDELENMIMIED